MRIRFINQELFLFYSIYITGFFIEKQYEYSENFVIKMINEIRFYTAPIDFIRYIPDFDYATH
jgi:hypothetical protein